jgi:hypothetical protein
MNINLGPVISTNTGSGGERGSILVSWAYLPFRVYQTSKEDIAPAYSYNAARDNR